MVFQPIRVGRLAMQILNHFTIICNCILWYDISSTVRVRSLSFLDLFLLVDNFEFVNGNVAYGPP